MGMGFQCTAANLLAPIPQQAAADLVPTCYGSERRARLLGLGHDPEFLLQTPAATAVSPDDDFHPTCLDLKDARTSASKITQLLHRG